MWCVGRGVRGPVAVAACRPRRQRCCRKPPPRGFPPATCALFFRSCARGRVLAIERAAGSGTRRRPRTTNLVLSHGSCTAERSGRGGAGRKERRGGEGERAGGSHRVTIKLTRKAYGVCARGEQKMADVSSACARGNTALHDAAYSGHASCVRLLLSFGAQPSAR